MTSDYRDKRFYSEAVYASNKGAIISCFDAYGHLQNQFAVNPGFRLFEWLAAIYKTKVVTNRLKMGHTGQSKTPVLKNETTDLCYFVLENPDENVLLYYYTKEEK
jgi:hypothetical protein